MQRGIHPEQFKVDVQCACGAIIPISSTKKDIGSTLCSHCHPHYTGAQRFVDTAGRIEKFKKKFSQKA
jgi:large subunit ribosomal protein L31